MVAREILPRRSPLTRGGWRFFLVSCVSRDQRLLRVHEWGAALATGEGAAAFLGTQGDVWDTQWDMFMAMIGALTAQLTLARLHDAQFARL